MNHQCVPAHRKKDKIVENEATYIDPAARIFGQVNLKKGSSIWPFASLRAEANEIVIGRFSNVQDHAMLHIGYNSSVIVQDYCSIAHGATLHGCTIEDACLVGIGATVMDGCIVGRGSIVAGHSFVREGSVIPPHSVVMGTPANIVATRDQAAANVLNALRYYQNAQAYAAGNHRAWEVLDPELKERAGVIARTLRSR